MNRHVTHIVDDDPAVVVAALQDEVAVLRGEVAPGPGASV